ncbi:MAG: hemolysin III family protein [Pseudomonadota bacterium]
MAAAARRTDIPVFKQYSRGELIADGIVHGLGVAVALMGVPVMITLAALWHGSLTVVAAAAIYGLSMIAMFAFSAGYNMVWHPRAKALLRRCDRGAIFVKIAGTNTPFAVLLGGAEAGTILIGIWTTAVLGIVLVLAAPRAWEGPAQLISLVLYLGMGWAVVIVGGPVLSAASEVGLILMFIGGGLYTIGVAFHLWDRLPYQNAIWHGHVLAASAVFYAAVLVEVGATAP